MIKDFDNSPVCDKCSFDRTVFTYTKYAFQNFDLDIPERNGEIIMVKCLRCGYEWAMKCSDNVKLPTDWLES